MSRRWAVWAIGLVGHLVAGDRRQQLQQLLGRIQFKLSQGRADEKAGNTDWQTSIESSTRRNRTSRR